MNKSSLFSLASSQTYIMFKNITTMPISEMHRERFSSKSRVIEIHLCHVRPNQRLNDLTIILIKWEKHVNHQRTIDKVLIIRKNSRILLSYVVFLFQIKLPRWTFWSLDPIWSDRKALKITGIRKQYFGRKIFGFFPRNSSENPVVFKGNWSEINEENPKFFLPNPAAQFVLSEKILST